MWSALGKYKSIVVSIALFLLLDASVLILNFYISFKISDDAIGVNLAGRQRMLSQRMVKSLYELDSAEPASPIYDTSLQELALSHDLFDRTLSAFDIGGTTNGADNSQVELEIVDSPQGRRAIDSAKLLWNPYSEAIATILDSPSTLQLDSEIQRAITLAQEHNLSLLRLMNQLTIDLEKVATSKAKTLRYIQTAGITLAIVNFLIILFHFLGELKKNDRKLEAARKETDEILDTVNEGLFLLNENQKIAGQYSACLPQLFGRNEVANLRFSDLIDGLVKPKDMQTAQRFIGLLFRPDVNRNLINDLNPLNEVELQIPDKSGTNKIRYLSFDFKRVEDEKEKNVLVTVNDITRRVMLATELEQEKQRNEQKMEMLTSILHADPSSLRSFIDLAFERFTSINMILKDQSTTNELFSRKLEKIFVEIHSFKGDSAMLGLTEFSDQAHRFEQKIKEVQTMPIISGNDFLGLAVHLENLISYTEGIHEVSRKLSQYANNETNECVDNMPKNSTKWEKLKVLAKLVAEREKKRVYITLAGLSEPPLSRETERLINDLCVQLIRNSIVHSIESSHQRQNRHKPIQGRIDVNLVTLPNGDIELSVTDDGEGINYELIRAKALTMTKWDQAYVKTWGKKRLLKLIFEPGFSTATVLSKDAGQGMGMNVIRERITQVGGRLKVYNRYGVKCKFTATFPGAIACKEAA